MDLRPQSAIVVPWYGGACGHSRLNIRRRWHLSSRTVRKGDERYERREMHAVKCMVNLVACQDCQAAPYGI